MRTGTKEDEPEKVVGETRGVRKEGTLVFHFDVEPVKGLLLVVLLQIFRFSPNLLRRVW